MANCLRFILAVRQVGLSASFLSVALDISTLKYVMEPEIEGMFQRSYSGLIKGLREIEAYRAKLLESDLQDIMDELENYRASLLASCLPIYRNADTLNELAKNRKDSNSYLVYRLRSGRSDG